MVSGFRYLNRSLQVVKKHLHVFLFLSILLGLGNVWLFGGFHIDKRILVGIVILLVIYPVMINTRFEEILTHFSEPRPIFCSLGVNFIVSPLVALGLGMLFFSDQAPLFTALALISLLPTSSMSVAWTAFSGARVATALYLIPLNILAAAFIGLPFLFPVLTQGQVDVNPMVMMKNVLMIFFLPLFAGDITRRLLIRKKGADVFKNKIQPRLGLISAVGVLVLVFLVMSLKRNVILLENMQTLAAAVVPVFLYYCFLYAVTWAWALFLIRRRVVPAEKAVVIIYTSVARHINIAIAITLSVFSLEAASMMMVLLIIAYMIQVPSLAVFAQKIGKKMVSESSQA